MKVTESPFVQIGPFKGGINNIESARNLPSKFLTQGKNIDIDNIGYIDSRAGQTEISDIATHSLWANKAGTINLFVQGSILYRDLDTPVALRSGLTSGLPMVYAEFNDTIVYSNNKIIEYTDGYSIVSFVTAFASQMAKKFKPFKAVMKPGTLLEFHNGRLYVIKGGVITFSDSLAFVRKDTRFYNLPMAGYINMFKSVKDGIWLSFGGKTYFMAGAGLEDFVLIEKADYGAIGQAVNINREFLSIEGLDNDAVMWMSERGICIGTHNGSLLNISTGLYQIPDNTKNSTGILRIKNNGTAHFVSSVSN